jgi:prolyl-tRNA synthetase
MLFKDSLRSYRDLPIRWGELGTVYRYERERDRRKRAPGPKRSPKTKPD